MVKKFTFIVLILFLISQVIFCEENESNKNKEVNKKAKDSKTLEEERALDGIIIFQNDANESICLIENGKVVSWELGFTMSVGEEQFYSYLSDGLVGLFVKKGKLSSDVKKLKVGELYDNIAIFPDKEHFFISVEKRAFKCSLKGRRKVFYSFHGLDPEITGEGNKIFVVEVKNKIGKIVCYDLEKSKKTDFSIDGTENQWWPRLSKDGKRMVYLEGPYDNSDLILYNLETKEKTKLVSREKRPVHPCWAKDNSFLIYASLQDHELHKYDFATNEDIVLTASQNLKLYPSIGGDNKRILYSEATVEGKGEALAGVFILKWLDMESSKTYIVPLGDKPKYLSAIRAHWVSE